MEPHLDLSPPAPDPTDSGGQKRFAELLRMMGKVSATDLHLKTGCVPVFRIHGELKSVKAAPLQPGEVEAMVEPILDAERIDRFRAGRDVDMAHENEAGQRFRMNLFRQRGELSAAIRRVKMEIPTFEELHLPGELLKRIAAQNDGLVLVCGVTGSGKSTTLAAMIESINATRRCHIVTIEDPIEYVYRDKRSVVNQREIGLDVEDFKSALKSVVRQDPDVVLIGEVRDRDTLEAALAVSETGHLVFGTLHSSTVGATIGRLLDLFPEGRAKQIRQSLRFNLRAVICQKLLTGATEAAPLVPAFEILVVNATAKKAISEGEDQKLDQIVRAGREEGMTDFNTSLLSLVKRGLLSEETAIEASSNPDQLKINLKGIFLADDRKILS